MKIWTSFYSLFPETHLNANVAKEERKGALLKIEYDEDRVGYCDYHNPDLLNDCNLFESLREIKAQVGNELFERSLSFAKLDSLKDWKNISNDKIKNHYLITDIENITPIDILQAEASGFDRFKVKMGRSLRKETMALKKICEGLGAGTKVRLDFNASVDRKDFKIWLDKNSDWLISKIDFIEDPLKYDADYWAYLRNKYNLRLALDLEANPLDVEDKCSFDVIVVKPALQDVDAIVEKYKNSDKEFVWTHSMDHPIGQACAVYSALKYKNLLGERMLDCGLLSGDLFEGFEAMEYVCSDGPYVLLPAIEAWGFKDYVEGLKWHKLT